MLSLQTASTNVLLQVLDQSLTDAVISFRFQGQERQVGRRAEFTGSDEPDFVVDVRDPQFFSRVISQGNLGMGESYMDGGFTLRRGTLQDFLTVLLRNRIDQKVRGNWKLTLKVLGIRLLNWFRGSAGNVQSHYDIGDDLFETFLDPTMAYSCGYVEDENDSLEQLQKNKFDRICRKLELKPGDRLLDIGCGFGGLLIHAATNYGAIGYGVTTSKQHAATGQLRAVKAGLKGRVRIEFDDFRTVQGEFDKVVSVGMIEHLKPSEFDRYFALIAGALAPQGRGLVHGIGCNAPTLEHDPFIQKYIFPGSGQPKLSEMAHHLEQNRLYILDVENMVRHYAYTVEHWRKNFARNRHRLNPAKYDDRFCRMWEYYLCCGIAAAWASESALYQVVFGKDAAAPLALHRV
jgi:cyclopropane-fatty-acyl-phospholipid synthase